MTFLFNPTTTQSKHLVHYWYFTSKNKGNFFKIEDFNTLKKIRSAVGIEPNLRPVGTALLLTLDRSTS